MRTEGLLLLAPYNTPLMGKMGHQDKEKPGLYWWPNEGTRTLKAAQVQLTPCLSSDLPTPILCGDTYTSLWWV